MYSLSDSPEHVTSAQMPHLPHMLHFIPMLCVKTSWLKKKAQLKTKPSK